MERVPRPLAQQPAAQQAVLQPVRQYGQTIWIGGRPLVIPPARQPFDPLLSSIQNAFYRQPALRPQPFQRNINVIADDRVTSRIPQELSNVANDNPILHGPYQPQIDNAHLLNERLLIGLLIIVGVATAIYSLSRSFSLSDIRLQRSVEMPRSLPFNHGTSAPLGTSQREIKSVINWVRGFFDIIKHRFM